MNRKINSILIVIFIFCMAVSVKLSSLPVFTFIDTDSFWISSEKTISNYSFIYDICSGMILSIIFYFMVDVIPDMLQEEKNKKKLEKYWNEIVKKMEEILSITIMLFTNKNVNNLQLNDLASIRGNTSFSNEIIYYSQSIYKEKKRITGYLEYRRYEDLVKNNIEEIIKQLNNIKAYSDSFTKLNGMIELMSEIETSDFITQYGSKSNQIYTFYNSDDVFYKFYCLYNKLLKKHFNNEISMTRVLEGKEKEEYAYRITNNNEIFLKLGEYHKNRIEYLNNEKITIIYDDLEFSKKVVSYLDYIGNITIKYIDYNNTKDIDINSKLHLYVLSKGHKSLKINTNVHNVVFQPKYQIKNVVEINKNNTYYINYQKPIKIFNICLFENSPSKSVIEKIQTNIANYINKKYSLKVNF